jgi:hypothetical protein
MAMIVQVLSRLSRLRITLGYAAVLVGVSAALVDLSPRARAHVVAQASTNLHNLAHGHVGTLLGSAFIADTGPMYFWLPCLVCLLALAELIWRSGRRDAAGRRWAHRGDRIPLVAAGGVARKRCRGQLWRGRGARCPDVGHTSAAAPGLDRLLGSGGSRRGRTGRRLHRRRARRRVDIGHAGRYPTGRPSALDAGAVRTAGGVRNLRLLDPGARRVVDGGCGGRRRGGRGSGGVTDPLAGDASSAGARACAGAGTQRLSDPSGHCPRVQPAVPQRRQRFAAVVGGQIGEILGDGVAVAVAGRPVLQQGKEFLVPHPSA